ncbi:hypothetical protein FJW06_29445 [Mesorhizobium sp. B4-1-3]|nr:hypothetical protein FJW06_29445 [Mesorhizobium sp. B4-1-3]
MPTVDPAVCVVKNAPQNLIASSGRRMQRLSRLPIVSVISEYAGFPVNAVGPVWFGHAGCQHQHAESVHVAAIPKTPAVADPQQADERFIARVAALAAFIEGVNLKVGEVQLIETEDGQTE